MPTDQLNALAAAITAGGYRSAADQLGVSLATAYRLTRRHLPELHHERRRPRIPAGKSTRIRHALLSADRKPYREIADRERVSPHTVCRLAAAIGLSRRPEPEPTPQRCPGCGARIITAHCVACAVLAN